MPFSTLIIPNSHLILELIYSLLPNIAGFCLIKIARKKQKQDTKKNLELWDLQFNSAEGEHGSRWETIEKRKELFKTVNNESTKSEIRIEQLLLDHFKSNNYNTVFTTDGNYKHVRPDNKLLPVLLGFDPIAFESVTWKQYKSEKKN